MRTAGFDHCIAVQARQTLDETRWLLALADQYPFIAGVVGWVDLQAADVDAELGTVAGHPRLVGIRHVVQSEPARLPVEARIQTWNSQARAFRPRV